MYKDKKECYSETAEIIKMINKNLNYKKLSEDPNNSSVISNVADLINRSYDGCHNAAFSLNTSSCNALKEMNNIYSEVLSSMKLITLDSLSQENSLPVYMVSNIINAELIKLNGEIELLTNELSCDLC